MVRFIRHKSPRIIQNALPHLQKYFPYQKPEIDQVSPSKAELAGKIVKAPFDLAIGQVKHFNQNLYGKRENLIKVEISKLVLNRFFLKYFYQTGTFWVHDQGISTKVDDFVLIEKCNPPIAFNTVYKLKEVLLSSGNLIDPITRLPCHGENYSVEILERLVENNNNDKDK